VVQSVGSLRLAIPNSARLVGQRVAVQGLAVGSGTCLGALRVTATISVNVR
jgi:hypothetical protein